MQRIFPLLLLSLFFFISTFQATGQEAIEISDLLEDKSDISVRDMSRINRKVVVADSLKGWQLDWVSGLNGAQASYDNWSQGGVNTISVTASTVFDAKFRKNQFAYALATNFKYGKARLEGEGTRKTDDRIAVNNKFSYLFEDERWSAFANINFSTQFDQGYDYNVPEDEDPKLISKFFAPAYFTQIAGIAYNPTDYFTAEAGMALKQTIVSDTTLSTRYGLEVGEQFRFEPGYSVAMSFERKVFSNVKLISSVETFTNLQRHVDNTDVNFSNELIGKINDVMNMSVQFVMIYDSDFSREVQIKQVLSAGISYSIL
ncbi:DUF3078 domain-containing protein [Fodinibius halophilus]|uniref:DUF3078 domain-containing protein n=1 Tax=Fodinibius halophilus TaxID=1736908 RepID=A0A6M1T828_9BACT|nr:DUF3078 domain-containing protein [Fodinibius halophilus]NGP89595.1 DUF3078 domain-containing protein [Fodinibius halophilus]